jgi:hypothetical protein
MFHCARSFSGFIPSASGSLLIKASYFDHLGHLAGNPADWTARGMSLFEGGGLFSRYTGGNPSGKPRQGGRGRAAGFGLCDRVSLWCLANIALRTYASIQEAGTA